MAGVVLRGARYSQVHLSYDVPDYVKLAEAYSAVGLRAEAARGGRRGDREGPRSP